MQEGKSERCTGTEKNPEGCWEDLQKIVAGWLVIVGPATAAFKQALLEIHTKV